MDLNEKIAYLQGLSSGLSAGTEEGAEGEVLSGVLEVLQDLATEVEATQATQLELEEEVEDLRGDVTELADEIFADVETQVKRWQIECPACGRSFPAPDGSIEGVDLVCPNCGEVVHDFTPDLDYDEDEGEISDKE